MNLVLARVDDRLIHGQVVVACCPAMGAERIILANDAAAGDELQVRLYRAAVPPSIEVEILSLPAAAGRLRALEESGDEIPTLLVVEDPGDMLTLVAEGAPVAAVNLGGLHHHANSEEFWPGFFLDASQVEAVRRLVEAGVEVYAQTVPGAPKVDARERVERR